MKRKRQKRKYKIYWYECHNPLNWAHCPELEEKREKLCVISTYEKPDNYFEQLSKIDEKIEQNGIKKIMEQFSPESTWSYDSDDGWIEVQAVDTFEAKDIVEAKKIASEYDCGDNGIFTVIDEYGERLFDEEDLEVGCGKT